MIELILLEFGFPSTHACNCASITLITLLYFWPSIMQMSIWGQVLVMSALWIYAIGLPSSRVYCGMHTTTDVTVGSLLGYTVALVHWYLLYPAVTQYLLLHDIWFAFVISFVGLLLIMHPNPLRECPCYEDSLCFGGVLCKLLAWNAEYTSCSD